MMRSCPGCGTPKKGRGYCARCIASDPKKLTRALTGRWSPDRDEVGQHRFRRQIRKRAGDRCEAVEGGVRCAETEKLQAHHLRKGYEPEDGVLLCPYHHRLVDPYARAT